MPLIDGSWDPEEIDNYRRPREPKDLPDTTESDYYSSETIEFEHDCDTELDLISRRSSAMNAILSLFCGYELYSSYKFIFSCLTKYLFLNYYHQIDYSRVNTLELYLLKKLVNFQHILILFI